MRALILALAIIATPASADILETASVGSFGRDLTAALRAENIGAVKVEKVKCRPDPGDAYCNYFTTGMFGISARGNALSAPPDRIVFSTSDLSKLSDLPIVFGGIMLAVDPNARQSERWDQFKRIIDALSEGGTSHINGSTVRYETRARSDTEASIIITKR